MRMKSLILLTVTTLFAVGCKMSDGSLTGNMGGGSSDPDNATSGSSLFSIKAQEMTAPWHWSTYRSTNVRLTVLSDGSHFVVVPTSTTGMDFVGSSITETGDKEVLVKYAANGSVAWRIRLISSSGASFGKIYVNSSNEVFVTGSFDSELSLRDASGVDHHISDDTQKGAFIAKLSTAGGILWTNSIESDSFAQLNDVSFNNSTGAISLAATATLSGANAKLTQYVNSSASASSSLTAMGQGGYDNLTITLTSGGALSWVRTAGSSKDDNMWGYSHNTFVKTGSDGSVYSTFNIGESNQSDNSTGQLVDEAGATIAGYGSLATGPRNRCVTVKFNSTGAPQWKISGGEGCQATGIDSSDNFYVAGFNHEWIIGGGGFNHLFVDSASTQYETAFTGIFESYFGKFNSNGAFQWGRALRATSDNTDYSFIGMHFSSDSMYLVTRHSGGTALNVASMAAAGGGSVLDSFTIANDENVYVTKLALNNGAVGWMRSLSNSTGGGVNSMPDGAAINSDGDLVLNVTAGANVRVRDSATTSFGESTTYSAGEETYVLTLAAANGTGTFLGTAGSGSESIRALALKPGTDKISCLIYSTSTTFSFDGVTHTTGDADGMFFGVTLQ